jgi:ribose transport system substrate-binding protein
LSREGITSCRGRPAQGSSSGTVANEKGIRGKLLIYAVDDIDETLDLLRKNDLDGTIVTSFWNYGYQAMYWLYQHITQGKRPAQVINNAGTIPVINQNINNYADALKVKKDL